MDSRRSLPLVKSIWALQWYHFRFLESLRNVRTLFKQTQKSETVHQILMIFCQMLDTIALNDLALVLCTKNYSFILAFGCRRETTALLAFTLYLACG